MSSRREQIMFSIIMPVYNNEKYFPLAVNSVLQQDFENYELIIIDDGSTDRTSVIADELAKKDNRIKVIHQTNQWIYASFNRGIQEATGQYIYILNSDDKLRKDALNLMSQVVEKYNPDVVWTKVLSHICDEEQNILQYDYTGLDKKVKEDKYYKDMYEVRSAWPFFVQSFLAQNQANLYKCNIAKKHLFRNDVYGADTFFNIGIASDINTAYVMKTPVYDFFNYKKTGMNTSVGKYYGYEHSMFNEMYAKYCELYESWHLEKEKYLNYLNRRRVSQITLEIHSLKASNCQMNIEEKVKEIFQNYIDEIVYECAVSSDALEELESRTLSGLRELLVLEDLPDDSEMYFAYNLLDSLLRYEKTEQDYENIKMAIGDTNNPYHIGKMFYDKLINKLK